jgi:superoxide reductase
MKKFGEIVQEADWKKEKHVPVIECADAVKADEMLEVRVGVGKEIAHPNTTEHQTVKNSRTR